MPATRRILIVLFDNVQSLDVTGPLEVFAGASRYVGKPTYTITTATVGGGPIRTHSGLALQPDADLNVLPTSDAPIDTLVVPGGTGTHNPDPDLITWLRHHAPQARRVVSVCSGALLLAEAGLLTGRRATTHWALCDTLAARHPDVDVDSEPIFVRDGNVFTSAGVTTGIDLALALVEDDLGRDAALTIARWLVIFLRRPGNQAQFSTHLAAQVADRQPLREVQQWIAENPAADLSVEALALRARLSPRHFARAFRTEVGMPPGRYVDLVRMEHARRLIEDTVDGIEQIARASGFGTTETMRRAFLRALGVSPAEYRRRFLTAVTA